MRTWMVVLCILLFVPDPLCAQEQETAQERETVKIVRTGFADCIVKFVEFGSADLTISFVRNGPADIHVGFAQNRIEADIIVCQYGLACRTVKIVDAGYANLTCKIVITSAIKHMDFIMQHTQPLDV